MDILDKLTEPSELTLVAGLSSHIGDQFRLIKCFQGKWRLEYMTPSGIKTGPEADTPQDAIMVVETGINASTNYREFIRKLINGGIKQYRNIYGNKDLKDHHGSLLKRLEASLCQPEAKEKLLEYLTKESESGKIE